MSPPNRDQASADKAAVHALVMQCFERMEEEGPAALEQLCAEHPDHAAALRRRFAALHKIGLLNAAAENQASLPTRLGDFRLLRTLGSGGMGVVYLAEQESLGREVALKLIRPENLYFPGARERFRREVEAVARMRHPGIVPVYSVGEENGIPYFAMEHVEGCTLEDVLHRLRDRRPETLTGIDLVRAVTGSDAPRSWFGTGWVEACFRLIERVAEALDHAHQQGVIHRDIKPTNVMITPSGRVVLLDFGLASSQGANRITRSGAMVGSVPYMAPEQVQGKLDAIDQRTDVYALGVTLYELLTLRSPYLAEDVEVTRRRVLDGRPRAIRELNSSVPWDAETVCLTAMECEPARRYATAAQLARDLENVLELKPIEARRPGAALRVRRFVQRHPAWTVGAVLGALLILVGPLALWWQQRAANRKISQALSDAQHERDRAREARALAEDNFREARSAVEQMLVRVGDRSLENVPQMELVRRQLLADALTFDEKFLASRPDDADVQGTAAQHLRKLGNIETHLGHNDAAREHYERSVQILAQLHAALPNDLEHEESLGETQNDFGLLLWTIGTLDEAEDCFRDAIDIFERLAALSPPRPMAQNYLADFYINLGGLQGTTHQTDEAEASFSRAIELCEAMAQRAPGDRLWREQLASALVSLGSAHADADHSEQAQAEYERGLHEWVELAARAPLNATYQEHVAITRRALGGVLARQNAIADAAAMHRDADAIWKHLTRDYPSRPDYRIEQARNLSDLADALVRSERADEAESAWRQAIELLEAKRAELPDLGDLSRALAQTHVYLAMHLVSRRRDEEAKPHVTRALELLARTMTAGDALMLVDAAARLTTRSLAASTTLAFECLGVAMRSGQVTRAAIEARTDLAPLHADTRWQVLGDGKGSR